MGWGEFIAWLETMRRQTEGPGGDPRTKTSESSLASMEEDPWYQQAAAERVRERGF